MEPMVIFSAGLVLYCGWIALVEAIRDGEQAQVKHAVKAKRRGRSPGEQAISAASRREGGAAARWPRPLADSA
jgi:hypothetical protein